MCSIFIEEFENILDAMQNEEKNTSQVNSSILHAYLDSKREGKSCLNFSGAIRKQDVRLIADTLRRLRITQFSISARSLNLIDILADFQDLGIHINKITAYGKDEHALLLDVLPLDTEDSSADWSNISLETRMRHYHELEEFERTQVVSEAINTLRENLNGTVILTNILATALTFSANIEPKAESK